HGQPAATPMRDGSLVTEIETQVAVTMGTDGESDTHWRLAPLDGTDPEIELGDRIGQITVGRDADCDLRLGYSTVSRLHARLRRTPAGWEIADAGSRNGTYLDDRRIDNASE